MAEAPRILLEHHLKRLKLPTFLREYEKVARQCAAEGLDHVQFLARLVELELIDRERRLVERRIKQAGFPVVKQLESFDFKAIPALNKMLVLDLARGEYIARPRERNPARPERRRQDACRSRPSASPPGQKGLGVRFATPGRSLAGSPDPPCPHPGNERRELSPQTEPKTAEFPKNRAVLNAEAVVAPAGPQGPPTLLRSRVTLKRYTKQRGSLLWIAGTTGNTVSGINKWPLFTPAPWPEFTPALTRTGRHDVIVRSCPIQTARFTFKERSSAVLCKSVYRLARSR